MELPLNLQSPLLVAVEAFGAGDCEAIRDGLLAQPVNALSSAAYVVAGLAVLGPTARAGAGTGETATQALFGWLVAAVGVGSILFHGPMPPWARIVHDLSIASLPTLVVARDLGLLRRWREPVRLSVFAALALGVGFVLAVAPDAATALTAAFFVVAALFEMAVHRAGLRSLTAWQRVGLAAGALLVAVAGVLYVAGRTGGPLCEPGAVLQWHAVWHVLTAVALALYARTAFPEGATGRRAAARDM